MSEETKEPKPRAVQPTEAEMELRVEDVFNLILVGHPRSYIVRYCAKKWNVGSRAVDNLLSRAKDVMKEFSAQSRLEAFEKISANYWMLYRRALSQNDNYLAASIMRDLSRISGLNEIQVIHSMEKRELESSSEDQLNEAIDVSPK